MSDITQRLRRDAASYAQATHTVCGPLTAAIEYEAADEIERLRAALIAPLSSAELRLVDKNCDWVPFGHAWNAVMKRRLEALTTPTTPSTNQCAAQ